MYEVYLERTAERDLKKLPAKQFHRLISQIKNLAKTPRPVGCRKIIGSANDWRIRLGEHRLIYEIDGKAKLIKIMRIKHRKDAYR